MREILVIDKDFKQLMDLKNNLAIEYFNKHNCTLEEKKLLIDMNL